MKISIISTSHRKNSQSLRVAKILKKNLEEKHDKFKFYHLDMFEAQIPLWTSEREERDIFWNTDFKKISLELETSDGFIMVVPEYGGMASPNSKNLFLIFNKGEFFHKPGLIFSISSGNGGSYPISDLRSSSYKNSHIIWIPENIIIRNVEQYFPKEHGELIPEWLDKRVSYACDLLLKYSECLKPIQKMINRKDFANGM